MKAAVFRGTFVMIAICVSLYQHMATGQPRIEVSIGLIIFILTFAAHRLIAD